jgi:hypothetical protein
MSAGTGPTVPSTGYLATWVAYTRHVTPKEGTGEPCPICIGAESPGKGCETGAALYGAYRLARIGKPLAAS